MDALMATARRAGGAGLNLLLPPTCMACDAPASAAYQLCGACFGRCHFITRPFCRSCGVPFAHAGQAGPGGRCPSCIARPPSFAEARAPLAYDQHARPLVLAFKHADRTELAGLLAPLMASAGAALLARARCIVPVPLHPSRLRQRGYNQSALLARALARRSGVSALLDGLRRVVRTPSLGEHDHAERLRIMTDAIEAGGADFHGRRVLLVDDVMTSGATANACARALLGAGATAVDVLVAARVPAPDLDRAPETIR